MAIENKIKNFVGKIRKEIKIGLIISSLGMSLNIGYLGCEGEECVVQPQSKLFSYCDLDFDCGCIRDEYYSDKIYLDCHSVGREDGTLVTICTVPCDGTHQKTYCHPSGYFASLTLLDDSICSPSEGVCVPLGAAYNNW